MTQHQIQHQCFHITTGSGNDGKLIQNQISNLWRQRLKTLLCNTFDTVAPDETVHRIDRLELDLGVFSKHDYLRAIPHRLQRMILKELEEALAASNTQSAAKPRTEISPRERHIQAVQQFLEQGTLPWWSASMSTEEMERISLHLLGCRDVTPPTGRRAWEKDSIQGENPPSPPNGNPNSYRNWLIQALANQPHVLNRLILQFSHKAMETMLRALIKGERAINALERAFQLYKAQTRLSTATRRLFLQTVIPILIPSFNGDLDSFLKQCRNILEKPDTGTQANNPNGFTQIPPANKEALPQAPPPLRQKSSHMERIRNRLKDGGHNLSAEPSRGQSLEIERESKNPQKKTAGNDQQPVCSPVLNILETGHVNKLSQDSPPISPHPERDPDTRSALKTKEQIPKQAGQPHPPRQPSTEAPTPPHGGPKPTISQGKQTPRTQIQRESGSSRLRRETSENKHPQAPDHEKRPVREKNRPPLRPWSKPKTSPMIRDEPSHEVKGSQTPALKPQPHGTKRVSWLSTPAKPTTHYVQNAGLALLAPFFGPFFQNLNLLDETGFVNEDAQIRAVHLIQYLIHGTQGHPEHRLTLNKVITSLPLHTPLPLQVDLTRGEQEECEDLLKSVLQLWSVLKNTSIDGLRSTFLIREGALEDEDHQWLLRVERQSFDLLMEHIPWGWSVMGFSWMKKPLQVAW